MNTHTASPAYYIADAPRGFVIVNDHGDGETEWVPTYSEAADRLAELNDPEADR